MDKLTREQIERMTPEQLNRAIWRLKDISIIRKPGDDGRMYWWVQKPDRSATGFLEFRDAACDDFGAGDFSGDISAAWELVEEMGIFSVQKLEDGRYKVWYYLPGMFFPNFTLSYTAPLAICRAYLPWKQGVNG
jgi:hypothetical protein